MNLVVEPLSVHLCDRHAAQRNPSADRTGWPANLVGSRGARRGCRNGRRARLRPRDRGAARRARLHRARDGRRRWTPPRPPPSSWAASRWSWTCATRRRTAPPRGPRPSTGRLEVWVNNAGVMRTVKCWEQSDDDVRLECEVNLLGVIWGSRAAVDAMRAGSGDAHIINIASMSALQPVPGLAVYAATKHAVLGFSGSLQGDLLDAGLPITVHAICPDGADTQLVREHDDEPEAAIIWSGPAPADRGRGRRPGCRPARLQEARARGPALARVGRARERDGRADGTADGAPASARRRAAAGTGGLVL